MRYKERFGVLLETDGLRANSDCNYRLSQQPLVKSHYSHCMIPLLLVTNTATPQHLKTNHVHLPFLPFLSISLLYSSNSLSIPFHVSSYPFIPSFSVIYPLSVSASVSETPIYSNSIPYRTAHSLWTRSFSAQQLYGLLTLQLSFFSPCNTLCHQHPIAHGLTYHHVDSGSVDLFLMASACSSVNLTVRWRLFCVLHTEQMSLCLPYKLMRPCKPTSCFYRSIKAWMINECIFSP